MSRSGSILTGGNSYWNYFALHYVSNTNMTLPTFVYLREKSIGPFLGVHWFICVGLRVIPGLDVKCQGWWSTRLLPTFFYRITRVLHPLYFSINNTSFENDKQNNTCSHFQRKLQHFYLLCINNIKLESTFCLYVLWLVCIFVLQRDLWLVLVLPINKSII